jgi:uncharacterized protein (DUF1697 family)
MPSSSTSRHVALLRGINVGGKNKLPMADLARIFTEAGGSDVRTFIQSGNVVFAASPKLAGRIAAIVSREITGSFGLRVPIVLRGADELREAVARNPFLKKGIDPDWLHVGFLAEAPDKAHAASLDPERSPGDSFVLRGREIYLHVPNGMARTKLTNAWLDSKLATTSTFRNWRTVLKLLEMTQAPKPSAR